MNRRIAILQNAERTIVTLLIISFLLISCNSSSVHDIILNSNTTRFLQFPEEQNISFSNLFEYKEGNPRSIHVIDSSLVLVNNGRGSEYFIYNYSLVNMSLSKGFLKKGRGPNEAIGIHASGVYDNKLWAYDVTLKNIVTIDIENLLKNERAILYKKYPIAGMMVKMSLVKENSILAVGIDTSNFKISTIDLSSGKRLNAFGEFDKVPANIPMDAVKDAHASEVLLKPSGDKIVLAYNYTDIIEIYDLNTKKSIAVQGPDGFPSVFKVGKNNDFYYKENTQETRKAFSNGAVTDKYIYLVYSGFQRENRSEEDRFKWNHAKYIYIYDWNGNPVKKLIVDRYIQTLGVSKDDKKLYSFDDKTGYIINANFVD